MKKVLIFNHSASLVRITTNVLKDNDISFMSAMSLSEALSLSELNIFDLIIADVNSFPDGMDFIKHIRSSSKLKHLPILLLANYNERIGIAKGLRLGANNYVEKPFLPRELMEKVRYHLQ